MIWFTIFHCQFHFLFSNFYGRVRHPSRNVQSERYSKRGLYIPHRFVLRRRPNQVKSDRVYMGSWGIKVFLGPAVDVTNMNTWIAKCFCRNRLERQTRETDEIGWKKRNKVIEIEKGDNQQSRTSRNRNLCWRFFIFLTFGHGEAKCFSSDMKTSIGIISLTKNKTVVIHSISISGFTQFLQASDQMRRQHWTILKLIDKIPADDQRNNKTWITLKFSELWRRFDVVAVTPHSRYSRDHYVIAAAIHYLYVGCCFSYIY